MSATNGSRKVTQNNYLFREGDPPDAMYVVKTGKFAVVKTKENAEIVLAEIGPGAMVGEMAFFDNKPRSASVKAIKDSEVIALPYKALHLQFKNFPEWCKAIMRTVNDHLRNANQRIKELEKAANNETDLFPPHTITRLMAILSLVAERYGQQSDADKGLLIDDKLLRNYTIQIFHEPTHKMTKLMNVLMDMKYLSVEDLGEGRQKIVIFQLEFIFSFVEWYNDWLFKREKDRFTLNEEEIKVLKGIAQYARGLTKTDKGLVKLNLSDLSANSMSQVGMNISVEHCNPLIEKNLLTDKMMEKDGVTTVVQMDVIEKLIPFWELIFALGKVKR